jgi:hypothetical protein
VRTLCLRNVYESWYSDSGPESFPVSLPLLILGICARHRTYLFPPAPAAHLSSTLNVIWRQMSCVLQRESVSVSWLLQLETKLEKNLRDELSQHRGKSIFRSHQLDGPHPITLLAPCSCSPPPSSSVFLALNDRGRDIHNRSEKEELTKQRHLQLTQRILLPSRMPHIGHFTGAWPYIPHLHLNFGLPFVLRLTSKYSCRWVWYCLSDRWKFNSGTSPVQSWWCEDSSRSALMLPR